MPFSHGVMFCRIIFRGAVKRTVCAALVVRKRCSKPHRKDMRRNVSVFVSQRLRYAKFYGPGSEKLFDKQHLHVGDRSRRSAKRLWAKIPEAYRQHATFYTDQYIVYQGVIAAAQHRAISKLARKTNHIERFNNTLRQHVSRLVCEALSFSKKLAHHIGAIKLFICHYNLTRAAA